MQSPTNQSTPVTVYSSRDGHFSDTTELDSSFTELPEYGYHGIGLNAIEDSFSSTSLSLNTTISNYDREILNFIKNNVISYSKNLSNTKLDLEYQLQHFRSIYDYYVMDRSLLTLFCIKKNEPKKSKKKLSKPRFTIYEES